MTNKIIRWWERMTFWNKFRSILTSIAIGSEFALYLGDSHEAYKWIVGGAALLGIIISHAIEDRDGNGLADLFEKKDDSKE